MKKINVYVVTYNNEQRINENIDRFFATTDHLTDYELNYHVINNHANFRLTELNSSRVAVLHNSLRPSNSCGHLSRDYNSAIMLGFGSLKDPHADQVICAHDDSMWNPNWLENLQKIHESYTFYSGNFGCSLTSYLPEAVRKIGMWDERFAGLGYHEADYFLRALIYNRDKSSINDMFAGRVLNHIPVDLFEHVAPNQQKDDHVNQTLPYHTVSRRMFEEKWEVHPENWGIRLTEDQIPMRPKISTYMYYPYFELDIDDLDGKNYVYALKGLEHFKNEWK